MASAAVKMPDISALTDDYVDIERVSPPRISPPVKRMRGRMMTNEEQVSRAARKTPNGRAPKMGESSSGRARKTVVEKPVIDEDKSKWAIVPYKPPLFPLGSIYRAAASSRPKSFAVRDRVPGMRIRGGRIVPGKKAPASRDRKRKAEEVDDTPITILSDSEAEDDKQGLSQSVVGNGQKAKMSSRPPMNEPEKKMKLSSPKKARRASTSSGDQGSPKYSSSDPRARVKEVLAKFDDLRRRFLREEENRVKKAGKGSRRADFRASSVLMDRGYRVNGVESIYGEVPGVEVGDHFYYRMELLIISLHRQSQGGIDFIPSSKSNFRDKDGNAVAIAVSVIASGGYEDDKDEGDTLIYTGQGGNNYKGDKRQGQDQELVRGNLALKNCCDLGLSVRVVRGCEVKKSEATSSPSGKIYYYDGLYDVTECFQEMGSAGFKVWKYKLVRKEGQGELASDLVMFKGKSLPPLLEDRGERVIMEDISKGLEPFKVRVVGQVDDDSKPHDFEYIVNLRYPQGMPRLIPAKACSCVRECWEKCPCVSLNGGEVPYNENGALVRGKKLIYECSPQCRCRLDNKCFNRVSQKGLRYNLEVFKTKGKGWGVRSTNFISQGSFICEYIGEIVHSSEADRVASDEYLFDLDVPKCQSLRFGDVGDLVEASPGDDSDSEDQAGSANWTVDARRFGNVGRFINHSCEPNLFVQCVLYEHHDLRFPHIMLFAAEKISPYKELTYDYGYVVNSVAKDGNIKAKKCYCGARKCRGRLY